MPVKRHPVAVSREGDALGALPLDTALTARLRETYERVRASDARLAEIFYARLFRAAPQLRGMFGADTAAQARKLTDALDAVVRNLENPRENAAAISAMGARHAGYGVAPQHYDLVIDLLVESMRELLGPTADERRLLEWRMALRLISDQMIGAATRAGPG